MIALDTNVLIYAYDRAKPKRQETAVDLISTVEDAPAHRPQDRRIRGLQAPMIAVITMKGQSE